MRTRKTLAALTVLALTAAMAGVAVAESEPDTSQTISVDVIEGLTWQLQEQAVDGGMVAVPEGVVVTLSLAEGGAIGNGGCNDYSGPYTLDADALSFGPLAATMMLCESPAGDVEMAYFGNLANVATAFSDGGQLTLSDADGNSLLVFAPAADEPMPVEALEGPTWLLLQQAIDGELVAVPEGILVSLALLDGRAGGNGGCNSYFASYALDGASITFSEVGSTMMACLDPAMDVEAAYLGNLSLVAGWTHDGATLTFSDADGDTILAYQLAPEVSIVGSWVAIGINNGSGGVVSSTTTSEVTADFSAEGELTGSDGCNRYFTSYRLDGEAIAISDAIGSTKMACPSDELAEQSLQYFAALVASTTWSIDAAGVLEMGDDSGALQVSFQVAEG